MATPDWIDRLAPEPQKLEVGPNSVAINVRELVIEAPSSEAYSPAQSRLWEGLDLAGCMIRQPDEAERSSVAIKLRINKKEIGHPEGYHLEISRRGIFLTGNDPAGLFYGANTLVQIFHLLLKGNWGIESVVLPAIAIDDYPDFPNRGFMLDISRDKVPTMGTLMELVDILARLKVNQLQLYMEHTFAYKGHEQVWRNADPLSADDIQVLDAYCQSRFIELVPNQNSFGHMHRWLIHEPYRALAECPDGIRHPFSRKPEPFSLCPTDPGSLKLLGELYDQLLPNFQSDLFNIGLDETFDLGEGRSAEACQKQGRETVYLDFLKKACALVRDKGKRPMVWGDIVLNHPSMIDELPRDVILLEWGYEADHSFASHCKRFAESGLDFYVCPGTSSWNSIGGRVSNALANLKNAGKYGLKNGAIGFLTTDWGDYGHWQPMAVAYPGLVAGACISWKVKRRKSLTISHLGRLLSAWIYTDNTEITGQVICGLGNVYRQSGVNAANGSPLFFLLRFADENLDYPRIDGLTAEGLRHMRTNIAKTLKPLRDNEMQCDDSYIIFLELNWVAGLMDFSCDLAERRLKAGIHTPISGLPEPDKKALTEKLDDLIEKFRRVWECRNKPGGLEDSVAKLLFVKELLTKNA